ncbi:hypothetical protein LCGC14_0826390, partial [marine sediment metagenome]
MTDKPKRWYDEDFASEGYRVSSSRARSYSIEY